MLGLEQMIEIKVLHQQGKSMRQIAKLLNLSRNTVKHYLQTNTAQPTYQPRPTKISKLTASGLTQKW